MDKFLKYIDNKDFVRWVLNPDSQLDTYWNEYQRNNPKEVEQIQLARLLVLQFHSKKENVTETETDELFTRITSGIGEKQKQKSVSKFAIPIYKYAAIAILLLAIGATVYYQMSNSFSKIEQLSEVLSTDNPTNSLIVFPDGKSISIDNDNSKIEYQQGGRHIIVNQKDTFSATKNYNGKELNQLIIPYGKKSTITLSDGTMVHINAGSKLMYPSFFDGEERKVYLVGEGYFEVTHNPDKPFVVETTDLKIEVLGTKFNISAYPSDNVIETVLVDGKVQVKKSGINIFGKDYILSPNQCATYNSVKSKIVLKNVDVTDYVSWHLGFLSFKSQELSQIVSKIERYYKISINFNDSGLEKRKISGKLNLKDEAAADVLKVLARSAIADVEKINESSYVIK